MRERAAAATLLKTGQLKHRLGISWGLTDTVLKRIDFYWESRTCQQQAPYKHSGNSPEAILIFLQHLQFTGASAQLPSVFQVGDIASASIAAPALMAAQIWHQRGGAVQQVCIDQRHALAMFRSERYLTINGQAPADPWSQIAGYYQCGDGRWIQLHTNFSHHRDGVLQLLQCADDRTAVAQAIATWQAAELEAQLASAGMCASMIRTPQE
jgi:hypothetical protein